MSTINSVIIQRPTAFLIGNEEIDCSTLIKKIKNNLYTSLDSKIPICRFRGTLINKLKNGYEIVGWQRNISRLQKMDVSLPTIIYIRTDDNLTIKEINLDDSFKGSKGLLCQHKYLNCNIINSLQGKNIDDSFVKLIQVDKLHCFHLTEVLGGILSCLQIMKEYKRTYLFEEELTDAYVEDNNFYIAGMQKFSHMDKPVHYSMKLEKALKFIRFNEGGTIYATDSIPVTFFIEDRQMFMESLIGKRERKLCVKIKSFSLKGMSYLKSKFTSDIGNGFMCSNLFPQAFIGLFVQSIAMKMFNNNLNYVLHCLNGIQRYNNVPRCIGAIESFSDATKYFPKYDMSEILS